MFPLGPERTGRFLDYFFAPDTDQEWVDELIAFDTQVGNEDRVLVEGVQRGVRSGILAEGRILTESEQLVAHFQRLCAEALAG
jgi:choline monooxygenase